MNILFWIAQILLALIFTSIGAMKLSQPIIKLSENMGWVADFPSLFVRALGLFELVVGLLTILPRMIKILPVNLTIYCSYAIVVVMVGAIGVHIKRGEFSFLVMNILILGMAAFVIHQAKALA
ncbi:MAG: DoxX family protein [Bacteroidota bacterium]